MAYDEQFEKECALFVFNDKSNMEKFKNYVKKIAKKKRLAEYLKTKMLAIVML